MKRIAYCALHYGKEYLAWAVRSVQDHVDEIHFLYTPLPSFGYQTLLKCPDKKEELEREANRFLKIPSFWHVGRWTGEGQHRNTIGEIAAERGASQILSFDSDEVWDPDSLATALDDAAARPERNILVRFIHFWRSFKWVCRDACMPVRIINLGKKGDHFIDGSKQPVPVLHFGYAQTTKLIEYKMDCHGHKAELRGDWFKTKFLPWKPGVGDVHPTNNNFWTPEATDAKISGVVDRMLGDHPYNGLPLIE
jgi:hypothetical protein